MSSIPKRPFTTSARVYPGYLPYVAASRRVGTRVVVPVVAVAAVAAGAMLVQNAINHKRAEWSNTAAKAEREAVEAQARYERLQEAYGGRTNLEELEAAMKAYEETNPSD